MIHVDDIEIRPMAPEETAAVADLVVGAYAGDFPLSEVYRAAPAVVARKLTASNFAKLESTRPEDLAHALMGLVGETVMNVCGFLGMVESSATAKSCR